MKNKIIYDGRTFTVTDIKSGGIHLAASLPSMQLEANTFTAIVKSDDTTLTQFTRNTPLEYYHKDRLICITYVQTVDRVGPNKYKFYGTSAIGRLIEQPHAGGVYTGQTVEEVITDICGPVPVMIKSSLKGIKLYGWLPYASPPKRSARDNLVQVLFAIGAAVRTDLDGVLRIEGLWDGISGSAGKNKMYTGASTDYDGAVTQVIVTEHQYTPGSEEKQLFEGTAQAGDVITFDEPMHSLTATGFTIQASGANWARVSAGTGTLTGKVYVHNTRQVARDVEEAAAPNVKTVEDATLVSLVNSGAVAKRLADYYRCRERVDAAVVHGGEIPGDRLATYHPFDKVGVAACLETADITISGTLKAQEKLLVGYVPPQFGDVEYFDKTEIITEDTNWVPPEGVTIVTAVCIGGGDGGSSGYPGNASVTPPNNINQIPAGEGAPGGSGGAPGGGGKIAIGTMDVVPGEPIAAHIGPGGQGGSVSSGGSNPGQKGGATTFGELSSDSGSVSATGYTDIETGETYALPSTRAGIAGGTGSGAIPGASAGYQYGTTVTDYQGRVWNPGNITDSSENELLDTGGEYYAAQAGRGCGGGPAVGQNGKDGQRGSVSGGSGDSAVAVGGRSGNGGDAVKAASASKQGGFGGDGGHGGGGEGGTGLAHTSYRGGTRSVLHGRPGYGGAGGDGSNGIIILHYSEPKANPVGQFVDKNGKALLDMLRRRFIV